MPLWKLFDKYGELITYGICGVFTTLVNYAVYFPMTRLTDMDRLAVNAIAWAASVVFAFVANKTVVFRSDDWSPLRLLREFGQTVAARLLSLGIETVILYAAGAVPAIANWQIAIAGLTLTGPDIAKVFAGVLVVVFNYVASKFVIFRKK